MPLGLILRRLESEIEKSARSRENASISSAASFLPSWRSALRSDRPPIRQVHRPGHRTVQGGSRRPLLQVAYQRGDKVRLEFAAHGTMQILAVSTAPARPHERALRPGCILPRQSTRNAVITPRLCRYLPVTRTNAENNDFDTDGNQRPGQDARQENVATRMKSQPSAA